MTNILKALNLDVYIFRYSVHSIEQIGIGPITNEEIKTFDQAFMMISRGLYWKLEIYYKAYHNGL